MQILCFEISFAVIEEMRFPKYTYAVDFALGLVFFYAIVFARSFIPKSTAPATT